MVQRWMMPPSLIQRVSALVPLLQVPARCSSSSRLMLSQLVQVPVVSTWSKSMVQLVPIRLLRLPHSNVGGSVTLTAGLDQLNINTNDGNDNIDLDLALTGLKKVMMLVRAMTRSTCWV